jgi:hypothetical protein
LTEEAETMRNRVGAATIHSCTPWSQLAASHRVLRWAEGVKRTGSASRQTRSHCDDEGSAG